MDKYSKVVAPYRMNSTNEVCVSGFVFWNTDMSKCPRGKKVQLLGIGNLPVYDVYRGDPHFIKWCPIPASHTNDPTDLIMMVGPVEVRFPATWSDGNVLTDSERRLIGLAPLSVVFPGSRPSIWKRLRNLCTI